MASALAHLSWFDRCGDGPKEFALGRAKSLGVEGQQWVQEFTSEMLMPATMVKQLLMAGNTTSRIAVRFHVTETMVLEKLALMS